MVDIHTHILFGVDDGCETINQSLKMIEDEISQGVDVIVCTPHHRFNQYCTDVEKIKSNFSELRLEVEKRNLPVKLFLGQEIFYTKKENLYEMLNNKQLLTYNNSEYILLEFPFDYEVENCSEIIYNFKVHGYNVIVAHIERYSWMNLDIVESLINEGALIQVNAGSIVGECGSKIKKFTKKLLKKGYVNFIASDVHDFRPCLMKKAYDTLKNPSYFDGYKNLKLI